MAMNVGYAPMSTAPYQVIDAQQSAQFANLFPFFYWISMLIPFFYLIQKIASEKESKAREGMKMMGLEDGSYYVSWFIIFTCIVSVMSLIVTVVLRLGALQNINAGILFIFALLYSQTMYGVAFFFVAIFPTRRTSVIASILYQFITYILAGSVLQDPATPSATQYLFSIFPNVCMNRCIKLIFFYNFNTATGLTFDNMSIDYQGFSFRNGILIMLANVIGWAALGLYLD